MEMGGSRVIDILRFLCYLAKLIRYPWCEIIRYHTFGEHTMTVINLTWYSNVNYLEPVKLIAWQFSSRIPVIALTRWLASAIWIMASFRLSLALFDARVFLLISSWLTASLIAAQWEDVPRSVTILASSSGEWQKEYSARIANAKTG